ncbi:hypothetical protein NDU88_003487, partial [Pleurodeles waltl]
MGPPSKRPGCVNTPDNKVSDPHLPATAFTTDDKLDQILEATAATKQRLSAKVHALAIELGLLRADQQKLTQRVTQVGGDIEGICPTVQELEGLGMYGRIILDGFVSERGTRQSCTMSHLLFALTVEALACRLHKQIRTWDFSVVDDLSTVSMYADDTLIYLQADPIIL